MLYFLTLSRSTSPRSTLIMNNTPQVVSFSVPNSLPRVLANKERPLSYLLSLYFEQGVLSVDTRLWYEDSKEVFSSLKADAEVFYAPRVPQEFSVSRRSYLKLMFTAKEYEQAFYDLGFWCIVHGFAKVHEKLRQGFSLEDIVLRS